MTPQSGQSLSAEWRGLLVDGDWLHQTFPGGRTWQYRYPDDIPSYRLPHTLWLGRPGADGFIPWTGGENPLPGKIVQCRWRDPRFWLGGDMISYTWSWQHQGRGSDVVAWRPAPSVEGLGDPDLQKMQISDGALRATPSVPSEGETSAGVPWAGDDERWDQVRDAWQSYAFDRTDEHGRIDVSDVDDAVGIALHTAFRLAALSASGPAGGGGWQPIETAPKDGTNILAICGTAYSPEATVSWWSEGWTHYSRPEEKWHGGVGRWFPTHWQPLPEPPALSAPGSQKGAGE